MDEAEDELSTSTAPAIAGIVTTGVNQVRAIAALCNAAEFDAAEADEPLEVRIPNAFSRLLITTTHTEVPEPIYISYSY